MHELYSLTGEFSLIFYVPIAVWIIFKGLDYAIPYVAYSIVGLALTLTIENMQEPFLEQNDIIYWLESGLLQVK